MVKILLVFIFIAFLNFNKFSFCYKHITYQSTTLTKLSFSSSYCLQNHTTLLRFYFTFTSIHICFYQNRPFIPYTQPQLSHLYPVFLLKNVLEHNHLFVTHASLCEIVNDPVYLSKSTLTGSFLSFSRSLHRTLSLRMSFLTLVFYDTYQVYLLFYFLICFCLCPQIDCNLMLRLFISF